MSLFQSIVTEKYVRELDNAQLETAWQTFSHCFLNLSKQDNIRLSKEEQYQEGFLRDLFVDVFGYTLNPNPDYDITTEFKNQTGSKKADGAILKDGNAIGVIELKGMNTTDLSKIEQQAFGYKNNQPKCRYVITSNFQKLRLYIDNAVEFIEFNLFTLTQDDFALLYLLLHRDGIMGDLPAKLKSASLSQEEAITKQLYKDYSVFKRELFNDLTTNNPSVDNLVLFQKSQKLLDRLLFIFFAEDSHLLPANFAKGIISEWEQLKSLKMTVPLYDRVKAYFGYLDKGHKDEHSEIFAYNGGLFSTDELLDSVIISDNILQTHIKILSDYDFDSEVDVNILGHIFENSLTELDEVKAQLEGTAVDKSQTKRKKDGVFYTPKYITKYIVENTVGKLCTDKKLELGINEEDYQQEAAINKDGTKRKKTDKQIAKEKAAFDNLNAYREWLLQITICDPAVGSGAFLNEALNFLIAEHEYIVELETKLFGSGLAYPDIENSILENNLFGVDINEESVDIAKLSLWLRTAQPRRKLNNLNDNIKCGNSLIDDPAVAGDKAFNWQAAFPQVFAKGGFDVVIGNPPYVRVQNIENNLVDYYFQKYQSPKGKLDLSILFFEKVFKLINNKGVAGYISSSQWMQTDYGENIRKILSENKFSEIIDFGSLPVFEDVETYPAIFFLNNKENDFFQYKKVIHKKDLNFFGVKNSPSTDYTFDKLSSKAWQFSAFNLIESLENKNIHYELLERFAPAYIGCLTGMDAAFVVNQEIIERYKLETEIIYPYAYRGQEVSKYSNTEPTASIIYPYYNENGDSKLIEMNDFIQFFPNCYNYLLEFKDDLMERKDSRKEYAFEENFYRHLRAGNFNYITPEKLILKGVDTNFTVGLLGANTAFNGANTPALIPTDSSNISIMTLLSILNSKLISFYLNQICPKKLGGYYRYNAKNISAIPIISPKDDEVMNKGLLVSKLTLQMEDLTGKFIRTLQRKFDIDKLSKKLENWHEITYADFIKELAKKKIKMSLADEAEWEEYFLAEQTKAKQLIAEIECTDREIDQMVYKLYDLTHDEIAIIEAS